MPESRRRLAGFSLLIALYLLIVYLIPKPDAVKPARLASVRPVCRFRCRSDRPTDTRRRHCPDCGRARADSRRHSRLRRRFQDMPIPTVWLVMAAFFISRALINTGLARRIALVFVRMFGQNSLGICYALSLSDMVLATHHSIRGSAFRRCSDADRAIDRGIIWLAAGADSEAARIVSDAGVYECVCISAAMFFTGQASNPLVAKMAGEPPAFRSPGRAGLSRALYPGCARSRSRPG